MIDILVVDDDRTNLELIKRALERKGFEVHCATSGEEALPKILKRTFSLMVTDLNMTGLDGLELSRKAFEVSPHMPIIMITGNTSPELICRATEIGISKVLAKPFLLNEMLEAVRCVVENWKELASSTE
jgi:DNA-binding response OmpR family regulator